MLTDFDQIVGRTLPDCLRTFTGLWEGGLRTEATALLIVYELELSKKLTWATLG